jgi:hypothetical protein
MISLASGATAIWRNRVPWLALVALALPTSSIPFLGGGLMREIGADRSAADLAATIARVLPKDGEVVAVHTYPPSLPFYLRHTVIVATDDGSELTSNYLVRHRPVWTGWPGSPLRPDTWWRDALISCERSRVFVSRSNDRESREFLAAHLPLLGEIGRYVAFGPCGLNGLA